MAEAKSRKNTPASADKPRATQSASSTTDASPDDEIAQGPARYYGDAPDMTPPPPKSRSGNKSGGERGTKQAASASPAAKPRKSRGKANTTDAPRPAKPTGDS